MDFPDSLDAPADNGYALDVAELKAAHSDFLVAEATYRASIARRRDALRRMRVVWDETNQQAGDHIGIAPASVHTALNPRRPNPKADAKESQ